MRLQRPTRAGRQYRCSCVAAVCAAVLIAIVGSARAAPARDGALDPTFGLHGWVGFSTVGSGARAFDARWRLRLSLAPDGTSYIIGNVSGAAAAPYRSRPAVVRLTAQGTLDTEYGDGGMVVLPITPTLDPAGAQASDATLLPDGRLVIVGSKLRPTNGAESCALLLALRADGQVNPSYGPGPGPGCAYLNGIEGAPISSGFYLSAKATGSGTTWILGPVNDAQGLRTGLARLDVQGRVDRTFGANGVTTTTTYTAPYNYNNLAIAPHVDSSVSILASSNRLFASWGAVHALSAGLLDARFGESGYAAALTHPAHVPAPPPNHASAIRLDGLGRLWISGFLYINGWPFEPDVLICNYCVARLGADGRLDATFNMTGAYSGVPGVRHHRWPNTNSAFDAAVRTVLPRADGGGILAGRASVVTGTTTRLGFGLAALRNDGELDAAFGNNATPGHVIHSPFDSPQYSADMIAAERDRAGRMTMLGDCYDFNCTTGDCGFVCLARAFGDELLVNGFEQ